ncbi:MAG: hypothetical protein CMB48_06025 [Euryarchaeota archaeon]|nr:hypothetical protein [Euryarchaeota archaeon]
MIVKPPEDILQGFFQKNREVEMRPSRGVSMGIEWEPLIAESEDSSENDILTPNLHSLSVSPEELHSAFFDQAQHLTDAIVNQNIVIDISGEIPEKANENQRMISIESIANEFNGALNETTLQIPFKGISEENINIEYSNIDSNWAIKLSISSSDLNQNEIVRTFLLPKTADEPTANWSSNNLSIKF